MTVIDIANQIRMMRGQLDVLESCLRSLPSGSPVPPPAPAAGCLGDLTGILRGQSESTEQEIDAALYRGLNEAEPAA